MPHSVTAPPADWLGQWPVPNRPHPTISDHEPAPPPPPRFPGEILAMAVGTDEAEPVAFPWPGASAPWARHGGGYPALPFAIERGDTFELTISFADSCETNRPGSVRAWLRHAVHNLVAHPLLVLCPPLGRRLHDATVPDGAF